MVILVNSERFIEKNLLREASQGFVEIGENERSFLEEIISLDMVSWKSCGEKEAGGEFLYNNLERDSPFRLVR